VNKYHKGYRNLKAWEFSNKLAHAIYDVTEKFPKSEIFGLVSQMRRSAVSVPANIAEGYSRNGSKERRQFYRIALSSLTELEFYIDFSFERIFYSDTIYKSLSEKQVETAKVLTGLIKSVK